MSNPLFGVRGQLLARELQGAGGSKALGTIVFPATVNVADPVGLTDSDLSLLSIDSAGRLRTLATPASGAVFPVTPSVLVDSLGVTGRAVAPAAATVIATLTPAAGTYDIEVFAHYDAGAPAAPELNNMQFREGGAVVSVLSVLAVVSVYSPARRFRRVLDGATAIDVQSVGASTAGVGYNAEITAIRIA